MMQKEHFNIDYWLNIDSNREKTIATTEESHNKSDNSRLNSDNNRINQDKTSPDSELYKAVENVIKEIEKRKIDITASYSDWRDIAFALSDAFGDEGVDFFSRVSKFYPNFNLMDCDIQYFKCLEAGKSGITIRTFFYLASQAGIPIPKSQATKRENIDDLPTIPDEVYNSLPVILDLICEVAHSATERDLLLLGSLVTFSSCLPQVHGIYDRRKVYPNLYAFISAKASAGKGVLNHCRILVKKIHEELREESKRLREIYQAELNKYNMEKKDNSDAPKPVPPPEKMLIIPANSSATGMFQLLDDNGGKGLIFETEGDTLANTFKSDYGNYSDGFRKAFHHEEMSYYRRTDREYVEIESPRVSTLLSGTPNQIANLIQNAENGLFSRFMFYHLNIKAEWHNVFDTNFNNGLNEHFTQIGDLFYELFVYLKTLKPFHFQFTLEQAKRFNNFFELKQEWYIEHFGEDYIATIRRLGLIAYRIAMGLSVLRIERGDPPSGQLICSDEDFESTLQIIETLIKHSEYVYLAMQKNAAIPQIKIKKKEEFYKKLPSTFTRQEYVEIASNLLIPDKTAQRYIS